jgi:anaerobic glycerol-3-phosphate dehydrogenase
MPKIESIISGETPWRELIDTRWAFARLDDRVVLPAASGLDKLAGRKVRVL